jgi:hypothetical protein
MTLYDDSVVSAEDIDPDVLQTLDEIDLLDTLDSEDIAGVLTSNPSSNDTEGWIQKMKKPKNKKKKPKKKADTTLSSSLPITNKTPPLRPTMVLHEHTTVGFCRARMCNSAHTSPYLRKSPQQTLQGTGTDHKFLPSVATVPTPGTTHLQLLRTDIRNRE